jgi:fumarylacetoacetase
LKEETGMIDDTHDRARRSWVASANGHPEFPLQNLPLGVFSPPGRTPPDARPRGGVAIGDAIFDLRAAAAARLFTGLAAKAAEAAADGTLNRLMALGEEARGALRRQVFGLLAEDGEGRDKAEALADRLIHPAADCALHLPAAIGNFTDFFAGIHHARNGGRRRDPDNPLNPNYKYVPVAYHSRASSVRESGIPVRRPLGQRQDPGEAAPGFGPCQKLDYELELAVWIGPGNRQGEPVAIGAARRHIFGLGLVNDWSARDIQFWEMPPLGPFLGKNFASTISPWIVTPEALEPFRVAQPPRPEGDPQPLPYLWDERDQQAGAFDIALEALLLTGQMRDKGMPPHLMSRSNTTDLYWTLAQLVAHHTCGGCNLLPGDIFGSGTISGPTPQGYGSLMELSADGQRRIGLDSGETRSFLEDGDEVIFHAYCRREGYAGIGFGECRARILG